MGTFAPVVNLEIDKKLLDKTVAYVNHFYYNYKDDLKNKDESYEINLEIAVDYLNFFHTFSKEPNHNYWPSVKPDMLLLARNGIDPYINNFLSRLKNRNSFPDEERKDLEYAISDVGNFHIVLELMVREASVFENFKRLEINP